MFKKYIELLSIKNESRSHYVFIKYFNRFIYKKPKYKDKKHFYLKSLQGFSSLDSSNHD